MYRIRIKKAPGQNRAGSFQKTHKGNPGKMAMGGSARSPFQETRRGKVIGDQAGYGLYVAEGEGGVGSQQSGVNRRGTVPYFFQPKGYVGLPQAQMGGMSVDGAWNPFDDIPSPVVPQERLEALKRQQDLLREGVSNHWLTIPSTYVADPYSLPPQQLAQLKRQQDMLREDMRNWVSNPLGAMPVLTPAATSKKETSTSKSSKGLSDYQEKQLKLRPDFNRHGVSWLEQYGYAPTEEGYAQAMRDIGYEGDVNDTREVQKHLINLNLLNGNTELFEDLLKKYGMTRQGIGNGYDANWESFGYDPEMNTAGWVKEMLENTYADNLPGKRTDAMLEGLLKKTPTQFKGASVVDYMNNLGLDSSKENRKRLAQSFGINDYNYSAADNLRLLEFLKAQQEKKQMGGVFQSGFFSREPRAGSEGRGFYQAGGAVNGTLAPVDRSQANIEAEKGETAVVGGRQFKIEGEPHHKGGTPLSVPDGTFIFSNTRKLKIGGPMLAEFGKSAETKKKFTPAQLAKQYDLNRYQDLIDDPDADPLTQRTAQLMLQNNQQKLSKLALYQEAMKGFPQGVPDIALPALQQVMGAGQGSGVNSQESGVGSQEPGVGGLLAGTQMGPSSGTMGPLAGTPTVGGAPGQAQGYAGQDQGLPVAQAGGQSSFRPPMQLPEMSPMNMLNSLIFPGIGGNSIPASYSGRQPASTSVPLPSWFKLWTKSNTPQGAISPTGRNTVYDPSQGNSTYDDYQYWSSLAGRPFNNAKDYQSFIYNRVQKSDPEAVSRMWGDYGLTRAGITNAEDPHWGFGDGIFGARTSELSSWRPQPGVPGPATTTTTSVQNTPATTSNKENAKQPEDSNWKTGQGEWTPWWMQDKVNLGAAYRNRYGLNKYMPTYVSTDALLPNAVYYDPTRTLAAGQESAALQHMMNMIYAGPQRLRAVGSNVQGQGFGLAATTLGDYANRNVAAGNQSAILKASALNDQNRINRSSLDAYLKGNTIANQQYDNSVRLLNNDIRRNTISGVTNAEKTGWLNRLNPYYSINPANGQFFFKQGKALNDNAVGYGYGSDPLTMYNSYMQQYMDKVPGADRKAAQDFAIRAAFANKSQYGVDSDGDTRMSMSGAGYNPMAMMNMLGSYAPQYGE